MDNSQRRAIALAAAVLAWGWSGAGTTASAQGLLRRFLPVDKVEADAGKSYTLSERNGPWLVMAATFSGEEAERQAHELVLEFRRRFNLPAYVHDMSFDYSEDLPGRGIDRQGTHIRRRVQREDVHEWAVLVGDFESVDDPRGQELLARVKTLQPEALRADTGQLAPQDLTEVRRFRNALLAKLGKDRQRGPMSNAFLAPNPKLPREYFVPKGVDKFVADMNRGVKYSLLDAQGKYTVQIATFGGDSILQTSGTEEKSGGLFGRRKNDVGDSLVEAAENAHLLAEELRDHGIEAYEFHNRTESIVTVGTLDQAARRLPDGRVVPSHTAQRIIETFGAAYDTPSDPLNGDNPLNRRLREGERKRLASNLGTNQPQFATGLNPKHVKILKGKRLVRTIPIDIHPHVIEVPRVSLSAAYVR